MINEQKYTWVYIGYLPIRHDEDMHECDPISSTCYYFPTDYDAIKHALEYKDESIKLLYKRYVSINLFLIICDNYHNRIHDFVCNCI